MQLTWKALEMRTTVWLDAKERCRYRPRRQDGNINVDYRGIICGIVD
jgi:hypothetical protein